MGEIKLDAHNYRIHDDKNLKLIKRSLKKLGAGRSILIDADGEIIAGNATFKTAQELGIPVEVIKTDGTKIVALQRTDLHTQDRKRKEMALMDNTTSESEREHTGGHATPKPIALCSRAIKSSSRENETVLDVFGGSGSTLIACEQLNRKCYTMELDEHYCDVILTRWETLTGKQSQRIE